MGAIRVLLVDDSEDMRLLCRLALTNGPEIEICGEASDGDEAIALAATCTPDVILLDYLMPRMDGLAALPRLRKVCPSARVFFLSASASTGVQREAFDLGAFAVIDKAGDFGRLGRVIVDSCRPEAEQRVRHVLA